MSMGMFSNKFEKEERKLINEATEKGVLFEEIAIIRSKYEDNFNNDEGCFESFKSKIKEKISYDTAE